MITIIIFVLIIGVLIFVHELGHFLLARRNGIKAEEFGFGFPPRVFGFYKDNFGKKKFVWGNKEIISKDTVYSVNWIPLGGFVRIKGEDGAGMGENDSFVSKGAWVRIKVLAAGVIMNFILAWFLISIVLMIGAPEPVSDSSNTPGAKIQISEIFPDSPAEKAGIKIGDEILASQNGIIFHNISDVQNFINSDKGKEIILKIKKGNKITDLKVVPRINAPEGQGSLGIGMVQTVIKKYPWYSAIWKGFLTFLDLVSAMLVGLYQIIKTLLIGQGGKIDVAGPVGIAVLTKQVASLGLVYVLQFTAILAINLGIINALPFPALDGGRILFIVIEKIKGSPVSSKTEQLFHTVGFILLILLMIFITYRDIIKFIIK